MLSPPPRELLWQLINKPPKLKADPDRRQKLNVPEESPFAQMSLVCVTIFPPRVISDRGKIQATG